MNTFSSTFIRSTLSLLMNAQTHVSFPVYKPYFASKRIFAQKRTGLCIHM